MFAEAVTESESAYALRVFASSAWRSLTCGSSIAAALVFGLLAPTTATGQDRSSEPHPKTAAWTWTADANVFFGHNYQQRQFLDASAWESQNWILAESGRSLAGGRLSVAAMMSFEPFTLRAQGSPQLFQTGETYRDLPLVHYQHPHDLLMGLGATYRRSHSRGESFVGVDLVGAPTLGPEAFMHRESARNNPQAPLSHHVMDSTHLTPGVVRGGVTIGSTTLEGSVFRGAEPDENRLDVERPALDSLAARARFRRGPWEMHASVGRLHEPERLEPYDVTRITAAVSFDGLAGAWPLKAMAGWGANREFNGFNGNHEAYLLEWDLRVADQSTIFGRAEVVDKDLFPGGAHPKGQAHPHYFSTIVAMTAGYGHDLRRAAWGRMRIGADATVYRMPSNMEQFWRGSRSFHVFLRWRPTVAAGHAH